MTRCKVNDKVFAKVEEVDKPSQMILLKFFGKSDSLDPIKLVNEIKIPATEDSTFLIENVSNLVPKMYEKFEKSI